MLAEIFVIFQIIVFILFFIAFFTKQEIVWVITLVLSGILMVTSYQVEYYTYDFNETLGAYTPHMEVKYYPYLSGINILIFLLSVLLMIFDIVDKYGSRMRGP